MMHEISLPDQRTVVSTHTQIRPGLLFETNLWPSPENSFPNWYIFECVDEIDLNDYPPGLQRMADCLDLSRSNQFSMTNRGLTERFKQKKFIQECINRAGNNPSLVRILEESLKTGTISPLGIGQLDGPVLYHGAGYRYHPQGFFRKEVVNLESMQQKGIYGSSKRVTYVTRDFHRALAHTRREFGSEILLLVIDTHSLFSMRSIFPDPESLSMHDEFMKNFVVPYGIPNASVLKAYHLISKGAKK